ncbi:deoxyribodipyrimidine photo-lyase [Chitinophaga sedimenti]|uniref:deoxyribodipyrimidine photo-lyase n=1 Tax=Chitinophaga sedimenti TaxID=2033606 RepID=UPI00249EAD46|nr:deoxyribodipyrimidine photo-lyase [Chitinophaga sedimenti]
MKEMVNICWLRRDLRLHDNAALYHALKAGEDVVPVFIFDTNILNDLEQKEDRRVTFIYEALEEMQAKLEKAGSTLDVFYGTPQQAFEHYTSAYKVKGVYANHDYEPYARSRDKAIGEYRLRKRFLLQPIKTR